MTWLNIKNIVETLVLLFIGVGGLFWLDRVLKKLAAEQKNEHIKSLLVIADQAVLTAQSIFGNGETQKVAAAENIKKRLDENDLGKYFTEQQILDYIQGSYAKLKNDGSLDTIQAKSANDNLKSAEELDNEAENQVKLEAEPTTTETAQK